MTIRYVRNILQRGVNARFTLRHLIRENAIVEDVIIATYYTVILASRAENAQCNGVGSTPEEALINALSKFDVNVIR